MFREAAGRPDVVALFLDLNRKAMVVASLLLRCENEGRVVVVVEEVVIDHATAAVTVDGRPAQDRERLGSRGAFNLRSRTVSHG